MSLANAIRIKEREIVRDKLLVRESYAHLKQVARTSVKQSVRSHLATPQALLMGFSGGYLLAVIAAGRRRRREIAPAPAPASVPAPRASWARYIPWPMLMVAFSSWMSGRHAAEDGQ